MCVCETVCVKVYEFVSARVCESMCLSTQPYLLMSVSVSSVRVNVSECVKIFECVCEDVRECLSV